MGDVVIGPLSRLRLSPEPQREEDPFWECALAGTRDSERRFELRELAPDDVEERLRRVRCEEERREVRDVLGLTLWPLAQEDGVFGATGGELWRASVLLAERLHECLPRGARVLEVGAGLGVAGLTAARLGHRVLLTDVDDAVVHNLRRAIAHNGLARLATAAALDLAAPPQSADDDTTVLLAADVVYTPRLADHLAAFLAARRFALALVVQRRGRPGFDGVFLPALRLAEFQTTVDLVSSPPLLGRALHDEDFLFCRIVPSSPLTRRRRC